MGPRRRNAHNVLRLVGEMGRQGCQPASIPFLVLSLLPNTIPYSTEVGWQPALLSGWVGGLPRRRDPVSLPAVCFFLPPSSFYCTVLQYKSLFPWRPSRVLFFCLRCMYWRSWPLIQKGLSNEPSFSLLAAHIHTRCYTVARLWWAKDGLGE